MTAPNGLRPGTRAALSRALASGLIAALAALAACGSTTPIRYHTLVAPVAFSAPTAPAAPAPAAAAPFLIEVLPVGIPTQLDQPQMVVRSGDSGVVLLETERWAAPLADEIRDALSAELSQRLGTQDIAGLARPTGRPLLKIKVQVRRFDAWPGQRVQLDADWSLAASTPADTAPLSCQARFELPAAGGYPELVLAQQRAIAALAARIAVDARQRGSDGGAGCSSPVRAFPDPR